METSTNSPKSSDQGEPAISRRVFLKTLLAASGAALLGGLSYPYWGTLPWVHSPRKRIPGQLLGPSASLGHQLRDHHAFPPPAQTIETEVVIVGGGISGLSAAWWLKKQGFEHFRVLELENHVGGNAHSGENQVSAYPWGAHYVPLPSENAHYVRTLFEELDVIEGYAANGLPIFNELYLCHEPDERLFKDGRWQDGLIPTRGAREVDNDEIQRFLALMQQFRKRIGRDGQRVFSIPVDHSSQDPEWLALDRLSMQDWLQQNGFHSKLLHWYVNYCCRDDYGATMKTVSAWAGIHYFAARDGLAANAQPQAVLTWPAGNGWLVQQLKQKVQDHIQTQALVYHLENTPSGVQVDFWDANTQQSIRVKARQAIFAGPRFVAQRVMPDAPHGAQVRALDYSPWLVANLTLKQLPTEGQGAPLSWDNVGYHDQSLGYVVATHQNITLFPTQTVITYYRPLDHTEPHQARREAYATSYDQWQDLILADLKTMHPDIEDQITHLDVWVWGHGMIQPKVGYIWGETRQKLLKPWGNVHFAHTDMSGISIFEEAQYRGVEAAKAVLQRVRALA